MKQLHDHERFEMLVLQTLNSERLLQPLVFGGGTMLRLCYGLDRYSVDLDFYLKEPLNGQQATELLSQIVAALGKRFRITDQADKFNTLLVEVVAQQFPRRLKIEINKQRQIQKRHEGIAWSPFSDIQVLMLSVDLTEMAAMKRDALLDRQEIRDAYDLEFLLRQGVAIPGGQADFRQMLRVLGHFSNQDFKVKLGSILEEGKRRYYEKQRFQFLEQHLQEKIKG